MAANDTNYDEGWVARRITALSKDPQFIKEMAELNLKSKKMAAVYLQDTIKERKEQLERRAKIVAQQEIELQMLLSEIAHLEKELQK